MTRTFKRGGVHPPENKALSEKQAIETLPLPKRVVIPVHQNLGAPARAVVAVKDEVKAGQVIAEAGGFVSAPVHASISGTVKSIGPHHTAGGDTALCIEIQSDGEDNWVDEIDLEATELSLAGAEGLADKLQETGIVGMGGAAFPTHVKLRPPKDVTIDALILNGAECEPYLTADHRLMLESPAEVVKGIEVLRTALGVERAYVGIEDNKPDAVEAIKKAVNGTPGIEVLACKTQYPQGAEKQLIKALLDREVPPGKLPMHVGAVVQNVGTAYAAYEAVAKGKPLVERVLTVSGRAITEPKNLRVRLGTLVDDIIEYCGGTTEALTKFIMGGPMMGKALRYTDVPVVKATSGLLFFDASEAKLLHEVQCIRCGKCVSACPQGLVPCDLGSMSEHEAFDRMQDAMDCVECGSCQFICPANRRLVHLIRLGKSEFRRLQSQG